MASACCALVVPLARRSSACSTTSKDAPIMRPGCMAWQLGTAGAFDSRRGQRLRVISAAAAGGGTGGSLLDRPDTARRQETRKRKPPIYRVLLHNDDYNKREYVVKVLMKVVQCTVDDAVNIMQEAHSMGLALVTMCAQETAEEYCEGLRLAGLISTMEPAGGGSA